MPRERAYLREVGPRDGLQLVKAFVLTERKLEWCRAVAAAGVFEIEATSFVPAAVVPQFVDAAAVLQGTASIANAVISVLVPNLRGAELAFGLRAPKVNFVLSASELHNQANVRRTTDESIAEFKRIIARRNELAGPRALVSAIVATSFGCTIQGDVPESRVLDVSCQLVESGADEIFLADTVGYGGPAQVKRLFAGLLKFTGKLPVGAHFHDTRGLGLANVTMAVEAGGRRFDAALGGLGGCPFAPGATGNINSEDCAFLLASLGFETGIDIQKLIELRQSVESWLPNERFFGMVARAGLPKTFRRQSSEPPQHCSALPVMI